MQRLILRQIQRHGSGKRSLFGFGVKLKNLLQVDPKGKGDKECQFERWIVLSLFKGNDRLASDPNQVGKRLLRYLAMLETELLNLIGNRFLFLHHLFNNLLDGFL